VNLKESEQNYERENEEIQPSTNEEIARELVETNVKIKNGRYEMPVPFKVETLKPLPNNYPCALNRTQFLRRNALKNEIKRHTV